MKRELAITLSTAAVAFTLLIPHNAQARSADDLKASGDNASSSMPPQAKADLMVPAQATLTKTLDSDRAQPGQQFRVALSKTVRLKDGTELPRGTQLTGMVVGDTAKPNDKSTLNLRFTQAALKDGKTIPITATIVGVYAPSGEDEGYPMAAGTQEPNTWTSQTLEIDQVEAESGVELHSKIASDNSGTLVSKKNGAVKLKAGSEIALAIAGQKIG